MSLIVSFNIICAQNVFIPDNNFKQRLIDAGFDTNSDSEISYTEAEAVDSLDVSVSDFPYPSYNKIEDLTGIEALTNLVYFNCINNLIAGYVDFSSNLKLEHLNCSYNLIDTVNLLNLDQLRELDISGNNISDLDLSTNINLRSLIMHTNNLTTLDVTNNINLEVLIFLGNSFTTIDLTNNINLRELAVSGANHNLTELDISNCSELEKLAVSYIDITILDISQNQKLQRLAVNFLDSLEKICVWELPFPDSIEVVSYMNPVPFELCGSSSDFEHYNKYLIHKYFIGDILHIESEKNVIVELISLNGQLLSSKQIIKNTTEKIDMSHYASGLYLLRVKWQDYITSEKLIK